MNLLHDPWGNPVRVDDPTTSHLAAQSVKMRAGSQRHVLLSAYREAFLDDGIGEMTSDEALIKAIAMGCTVSRGSYWKRVSELHQMKLIAYSGNDYVSQATGQKQRAYCITQDGLDILREISARYFKDLTNRATAESLAK